MKRLIDKIAHAAAQLDATTTKDLAKAEATLRTTKRQRRADVALLEDLKAELHYVRLQVDANTHNLEIQFQRIAQIQAELSRLIKEPPPRFRGDKKSP